MNLEAYEKFRRTDYAAFAETVSSILMAAVRREAKLRLQHVQHRAKDPVSLKNKLEGRGLLDTTVLESDVKDLAGCRLVFYTNSDVSRFLNSGIVRENFDLEWDRTKIHYPSPDANEPNAQFVSNNYVVKLKQDRAALPEYAAFRDMLCEVQVQTTLNLAWSDMAHDTIYKRPKIEGFGSKLFQSIEKRMQSIARDLLMQAGYEFQKVLDDFERLLAGKELFDHGAFEALGACEDNNARYDVLKRFRDYVLPHYDDLRSVYYELRTQLVSTVVEARNTPIRPIETPVGTMDGHSVEQIVDITADILDYLRYVDVEATFDVICELFPGAESEKQQDRLRQLAENLSKHDLDVWSEAGPIVQFVLVKKIESLDDRLFSPLRPILLTILHEVLKPEATGTSSAYESIVLKRGALPFNKMLANVRRNAIGVLKKLYLAAETDGDRREVMGTLSAARDTSYSGDGSTTLLPIILENTCEIVHFYNEMASSSSYEILQSQEHSFLWLYRRNCKKLANSATENGIAKVRRELTKGILKFKDQINANRGFVVYKTLVGFDSVVPPQWESDEYHHSDADAFRARAINEFVDEVDDRNADQWLAILKRCAQTQSDDLATFPNFGRFIEKLGEVKPRIMFRYLNQLDEPLSRFLCSMLLGLTRSTYRRSTKRKLEKWLKQKAYLPQIILYLRWTEDFDERLVEKALKTSIEHNDDVAVLTAIRLAIARHNDHPGGLIDLVFVPALKHLAAKRDLGWINASWHDPKKESLFLDLKSEQVDLVLKSLVYCPQIEYCSEEILFSIAQRSPEKVVDFFGERLRFAQTEGAAQNYRAIPFALRDLKKPLAKIPDYVVDTTRAWFEEMGSRFSRQGSRLPAIIFPEFSEGLEDKLKQAVCAGNQKNIEFVVNVLRKYEGQAFLLNALKEIVEALPSDDPLLDEVEFILHPSGFFRGEFGRVDAYKQRKQEIAFWLDDDRAKVRSFAGSLLSSLDNLIASEQRSSEERLEMRKRSYGQDGDD